MRQVEEDLGDDPSLRPSEQLTLRDMSCFPRWCREPVAQSSSELQLLMPYPLYFPFTLCCCSEIRLKWDWMRSCLNLKYSRAYFKLSSNFVITDFLCRISSMAYYDLWFYFFNMMKLEHPHFKQISDKAYTHTHIWTI